MQKLQDLNLCSNSVFFCLFSGGKLTQLHQTEADPLGMAEFGLYMTSETGLFGFCV
jgi:hypothetical protein